MNLTLTVSPLTLQESTDLKGFIGECVMKNHSFKLLTNRMGSDRTYSVQELINSNEDTLKEIGAKLQKTINDKAGIDPLFGGTATEYKISGVDANLIAKMLGYIIREKKVIEHREAIKAELDKLNKEAEQFVTPGEKKKLNQAEIRKAETMLASLES